MKPKIIAKVINKKFDEFLESIKDSHVKEMVSKNTIITGGCITSMLLKEKVKDFDLYFTNMHTAKIVAEYYVGIFNKNNEGNGFVVCGENEDYNMTEKDRVKIIFPSTGIGKEKGIENEETHELGDIIEIKNVEGKLYRPVYISSNAITLSGQIQIIIRFFGSVDNIHDNYDFIHCTNYWTSEERKVITNEKAILSILTKDLFYIGSKHPLSSIIRIRKFIHRGWNCNAGQILKMCIQLNDFDLKDPRVLEEQLIGVDLSYFAQLIEQIKSDNSEKINYQYLSTIIDKIF